MKRRFALGLTGGIATGKTTLLKEFARRGFPTLSSDTLSHACLRKGHPCYTRVLHHFGKEILDTKLQIDRKHLGRIVFSKLKERKWLERQIHPEVIRGLKAFIQKHSGLIILDIPLLYEAKLQNLVDAVLVVCSSERTQIQRIQRRDHLSRSAALQRIHAQLSLKTKKARADYVILNHGRIRDLQRPLQRILDDIRRKA